MRLRELRVSYHPMAGSNPGPRPRLMNAADAAKVIAPIIEAEPVEVFGALLLNAKHEPLAWHVVSRGSLDCTLVHPRELIKPACLANAAGLVVAHNHPSGDPEPSPDDVLISIRLSGALALVGIDLLDSLVIGEAGRFVSLRERGVLR
jgi:DNA repair protein RadC